MPLGHAYKILVAAGDKDIDGKVVTETDYYYQWWRGLHCLMGKEGLDAGLYMVRLSFENFRCPKFTFKVSSRAVVQHWPGNLDNPTLSTVDD